METTNFKKYKKPDLVIVAQNQEMTIREQGKVIEELRDQVKSYKELIQHEARSWVKLNNANYNLEDRLALKRVEIKNLESALSTFEKKLSTIQNIISV